MNATVDRDEPARDDLRTGKLTADLLRAAALAGIIVLVWCLLFNRWTGESWQTPLTYREDIVAKGDVINVLAAVKAAQQGHLPPFFYKTIPELGAPYDGNWNDWPLTEDLLISLAGFLSNFGGIFAGLNLAVLVAHVLAGLSFYVACRLWGCAWVWSFAGALAFAFSRYIIAHGAHHFTISYFWHVPLCLLVCRWVVSGEGLDLRGRAFRFALVVAFITGLQNVYYTNMFAQLVAFGGLIQWMRKGWRAALPAVAIIACAAAAFFLMNADTLIYRLTHGGNQGAVERPYKWMEIAALKLVDLLVPPPDHSFPPFAEWGANHIKEIFLAPGEWPSTGYFGLVGIAGLAWLAVTAFWRAVKDSVKAVPMEAWQVLWIFIYADVGGLNCFAGTLGFCLFRGATRYSIFILAIVLMYGVKRLSAMQFKDPLTAGIIAAAIALLALFDQTPPRMTDRQVRAITDAVAVDRNFTHEMEQRLPKGAMVFQIPIMDFPESPVAGVPSYEHLRPYLFSEHLRYSFGSDKGRPREKWQQAIGRMDVPQAVQALESYGFAAMFINKNGVPDQASGLIASLAAAGRAEKIESAAGDLCCVILHPSEHPVLP